MTHKGENYSVKMQKYYFCNGTVVTLYLFNNGDQKITTNPSGWNLIVDGLKYEYSSKTFYS